MENGTVDNKRIAKNTLLLYARMLLLTVISLFTSRVVLSTLGVEDFGIYNVVGGVITMLSFFTWSLSGATARFITFDIGVGDMDKLKRTFGNIITIHIFLAILIFILGETVGLWFVQNKLQIPPERELAAQVVYQFSVLTSMLAVFSVPYNAAIIAHEKMDAFAYVTLSEAVLKLGSIYLLMIIPSDKLIMYGFFLFVIQAVERVIYGIYCSRHFEETKVKLSFDKKIFKEIFSYAMWTMNGMLAIIGYSEGINILLNLFFGPIVNAARGIAVQVQGVVTRLCDNFQMALNPQLTKCYAQNDLSNMQRLLKLSSKFSFFLLFVISLPLMLEADQVLTWWLGKYPEHSASFLRLILCSSILVAISNPVNVAVHATGKIKKFQLIEGSMLLCIVPIAYILLKFFNIRPEYVFCVHIIVELFTQYARIKIVLPMISMPIKDYYKEVVMPIVKVCLVSIPIPVAAYLLMEQNIVSFLTVCAISTACVMTAIYYLGCSENERKKLSGYAKTAIKKITPTRK